MLITNEEGKGMLPIIVTSYHTNNYSCNLQAISYQIWHHVMPGTSGKPAQRGSIGTYRIDGGTVTTETAS